MKEQMLDKIESYLSGNMDIKEEKAFDEAIEKDAELAAAVDNFGMANDAIELLIEDNLRKELNQLRAEESSSSNVVSINKNKTVARRRSFRTYLAMAASVAILVGFFGMNWAGKNYSNEAIATELHSTYNMPNVRAGGTALHPFADGMTAYTEGNFTTAIDFFNGIVVDDPRYAEAQFYLAQSLLEKKDFSDAAAKFKSVRNLNDARFTERAEWNQVVAQLSAGDTNGEFQTLLNQIATDSNHTFNKKALELETKLNSFWRKLVQ